MTPLSDAAPPLVVIGVLSAPLFFERRAGIRASWMRWQKVDVGLHAEFVVRSLHAPRALGVWDLFTVCVELDLCMCVVSRRVRDS